MASLRPQCRGCQQRDRRIAKLESENRRLRRQLAAIQRDQHRQAHPFRRDKTNTEAKNTEAKKPGRPKGHKADLRTTPTANQIDRVIEPGLFIRCKQKGLRSRLTCCSDKSWHASGGLL